MGPLTRMGITGVLALGLDLPGISEAAKPTGEKVDICHYYPNQPTKFRIQRIDKSGLANHLAHGDALLGPEICDGLDNDKYEGWGSTSFATPFVVGTAGLLMANFQGDLVEDPTLTRAVLMASASHAMQNLHPIPIYSDGVDDRAGMGAPRGDRGKANIFSFNNDEYLFKTERAIQIFAVLTVKRRFEDESEALSRTDRVKCIGGSDGCRRGYPRRCSPDGSWTSR